jgi:protein-S-isoprenylcysteine O-methyltransferase Ste14
MLAVGVLVFELLFLVVAFGARTWVQWRRTGDTGWRIRGAGEGRERAARVLLALGLVLAPIAPVVDLRGWRRWGPDLLGARIAGVGLMVGGALLTVVAQFVMGQSWRIGVDRGERTELVTDGLYRWARNPIYTGMLAASAGLVLVLPNLVAAVGFAAVVIGLELQVRFVEEPYLASAHGAAFRAYAARVGRFVPGLGRTASAA